MPRICCFLLFAVVSPVTYADVSGSHTGVAAELVHQLLGLHHLPFTALMIVVVAAAFRSWRNSSKRAR